MPNLEELDAYHGLRDMETAIAAGSESLAGQARMTNLAAGLLSRHGAYILASENPNQDNHDPDLFYAQATIPVEIGSGRFVALRHGISSEPSVEMVKPAQNNPESVRDAGTASRLAVFHYRSADRGLIVPNVVSPEPRVLTGIGSILKLLARRLADVEVPIGEFRRVQEVPGVVFHNRHGLRPGDIYDLRLDKKL